MTLVRTMFAIWILTLSARSFAQTSPPGAADASSSNQAGTDPDTAFERWNLYYQATSIGMYHGTFPSPYEGPLSLRDYPERDVSLTTTLFFAARLEQNTILVFNPEIAGGRGFSGVDGLANPAERRAAACGQRHAQALPRAALYPA